MSRNVRQANKLYRAARAQSRQPSRFSKSPRDPQGTAHIPAKICSKGGPDSATEVERVDQCTHDWRLAIGRHSTSNNEVHSITDHRRTWARSKMYWPYRITLSHSMGLTCSRSVTSIFSSPSLGWCHRTTREISSACQYITHAMMSVKQLHEF